MIFLYILIFILIFCTAFLLGYITTFFKRPKKRKTEQALMQDIKKIMNYNGTGKDDYYDK